MKLLGIASTAFLPVLLPTAAVVVSAFTPSTMTSQSSQSRSSQLWESAVVTGPGGKPASSFEEDLRLTLQLIMDHEERSTTTSKEQMVQQVEESFKMEATAAPADVSIPYDAPAKLAYEASDKSMEYAAFKEKYEADAVADVIAKKPVDVSIPYDAAAKLAYEASGDKSSVDYATFKAKWEADAVAAVIAKQQPKKAAPAAAAVDISIPYDAAAKLAYEASDKKMEYAAFKEKFEADAVAAVIAKQKPKNNAAPAKKDAPAAAATVDISIPYDAAAKLAYEHSDKSMEYGAFKEKYEADAVADVIAKKGA